MQTQPPSGQYQDLPSQYAPPQASRRASAPRRRSRRAWFWVFAAWHLIVVFSVLGGGTGQTDLETFSVLGAGAAVDVMIVAGAWVWQHTGRREA